MVKLDLILLQSNL